MTVTENVPKIKLFGVETEFSHPITHMFVYIYTADV